MVLHAEHNNIHDFMTNHVTACNLLPFMTLNSAKLKGTTLRVILTLVSIAVVSAATGIRRNAQTTCPASSGALCCKGKERVASEGRSHMKVWQLQIHKLTQIHIFVCTVLCLKHYKSVPRLVTATGSSWQEGNIVCKMVYITCYTVSY